MSPAIHFMETQFYICKLQSQSCSFKFICVYFIGIFDISFFEKYYSGLFLILEVYFFYQCYVFALFSIGAMFALY